ncbi:MAG: DUF4838 domain-containing protein [Armatimonadota bacterium]
MMKRLALLIVLSVATLSGTVLSAAPTGKVRDVLVMEAGNNSTAIVLPEKPTCAAQFAALDLQWHLEKITGEKPPIINEPAAVTAPVKIAVGATALGKSLGFPVSPSKPWEFLVAEKNGTIVLAGNDDPATDAVKDLSALGLVFNGRPNGTCRAAYEFLEENCGVHWYLPSDAGMVYPSTKKLVAKMGDPIRRRSDFRHSSFYPYQVNKNMFCQPDTPEVAGAPDSDMEKWRRGVWSIPVMSTDMLPVATVQLWLMRNKVGGEPYGPNHSFSNWLEKYGREHPEWFSYQSKERVEEILAKPPKVAADEFQMTGDPCLTHPGVLAQNVANAKEYFAKPTSYWGRFWNIVPNDNYVWCQCASCKPLYGKPVVEVPMWGGATGNASFYLWDFANKVAREIRKDYPEAWVAGLGYHDYMPPPKDFVLEPNVAVSICTYQGNWTEALRESAYGVIKAWRDQAKCQWIGVWEYFCYSSMSQYQPMFPKVAPKLQGEDVKRLYKMGVLAEFDECEDIYRFKDAPERGWAVWSNPIWLYLNIYTRMKVVDDTTRDVTKLLDDHYRLFYGPASKPIQQFFELCEARITDPKLRGPKTFADMGGNRHVADWEYLFPPEQLQQLRAYADEATKLAANEPYKTRVTWVRDGFLVPQERASARYWAVKSMRPAQKPREGVCYRVSAAPAVDGSGEEAAWKALPPSYLNDWRSGKKPKAATWFKLGYDDTNLYVLARCDDPDVAKLKTLAKLRDESVYADDCVELHLTFDPIRSERYQIIVNSKGVVQDLSHTLNEGGADVPNMTWNCPGVVTGAKVDDKGWTVEVAIPFASIGGKAAAGGEFAANIAREKYSGGDGNDADELQAWSATQNGFDDGKYFGRLIMTEGDAFATWFNEQTTPPSPALLKVDKDNPWTVAPGAMTAVAVQDHVRYVMKVPQVDEKGRVYAGFTIKPPTPISADEICGIEVGFTKPNPEVMFELIYNYTAADGKDYSNYWLPSPYGDGSGAPRVYLGRFAEANDAAKPKPVKINSVTIYAVMEGGKTPADTDFSMQWIRLAKDSLHAK